MYSQTKPLVIYCPSLLPGHLAWLHCSTLSLGPTHGRPLGPGAGFVHVWNRFRSPPPQLAEHSPHIVQGDQLPCTVRSLLY